MLLVAVTGGMGSGKSTVSSVLREFGGHVVDADQIAREVVAPGSPALTEIVAHFGEQVLRDGALDRQALAQVVFNDRSALAILESMTHPAIRKRFVEMVKLLPDGAIVIHEVPLLAEKTLEDQYHLSIGVEVSERVRRARLLDRGMNEGDIDRRLSNQFSDADRRKHCDVWISNEGDRQQLRAALQELWQDRIAPFSANILKATAAVRSNDLQLLPYQQHWPDIADRLIRRLRHYLGSEVLITHIGSTSVPGLTAKDVIDLQVSVGDLTTVDPHTFLRAGFAEHPSITGDEPRPSDPDPTHWRKRFFNSCDPGRAVNVHVRAMGSPGERYARLFPAWLRSNPDVLARYAAMKGQLAQRFTTTDEYAAAKEPWFSDQEPAMLAWAEQSGWH